MNMREKYKDEIINFDRLGDNNFCEGFINNHVLPFYGKVCDDIYCSQCKAIFLLWLNEEYIEPEITFERDELVEASHNGKDWCKRYYAEYKENSHYCYEFGANSLTTDDVTKWKYVRKYEV